MKVYLDVCCLNRLFDDQEQGRVAIEAAAVVKILRMIDTGRLTDYSSEMATVEIERIRDADRRRKVTSLMPPSERIMPLSEGLLDAGEKLVEEGFPLADAVHLAAAGELRVDVFLTVDDKLLRRAARIGGRLGCRVLNPVSFLEEVAHADER